MEPQITGKERWAQVETNCGTEFVPLEQLGITLAADLRDYLEGNRVFSVQQREGYGARLFAPGYLDCTDWAVFDTEDESAGVPGGATPMSALQMYHVDDWAEFITTHEIDLACPTCRSEGCDDCTDGYLESMWDRIWNTGFHSGALPVPSALGNVFAFDWDGEIWFGLSCCGMDCTPFLALAWVQTFPDCQWLPDQFIVGGCNLRGGYIESCIGRKDARKVYTLIGKTIKGMRREARNLADDLREARDFNREQHQ